MTETAITSPSCAKLVGSMQKEEWINTFLIEITLSPKITNKQLVEKYHCHRNTVSKYRKIIRERQLRSNLEIVNKIDNVLEDRLPDMEDRDLISYRKAVSPQELKVEQNINKREIKIVRMWQPDDATRNNPPVLPIPKTTSLPQ